MVESTELPAHIYQLLLNDPEVSQYIAGSTKIPYKRSTSLKDRLIQNPCCGNKLGELCKLKGTFACEGCFLNCRRQYVLPNGLHDCDCVVHSILAKLKENYEGKCMIMYVAY